MSIKGLSLSLYLLINFVFVLLKGMEVSNERINFNDLPDMLKAYIASQLIKIIGTREIVNKADFPVIAKNIKHLSLVNKSFNEAINSDIGTNLLINSFANRYELSDAQAAAILNTNGTREWLKNDEQYSLFKNVQNIISIVKELKKEAKGYDISYLTGTQSNWPMPIYYYGKTSQGLFLCVDVDVRSLCTPWGSIELLSNGRGSLLARILLTQSVLKCLETRLASFCERDTSAYYQVVGQINGRDVKEDRNIEFSDNKYLKKLSEEEIKQMVNEQRTIISAKAHCLLKYEICKVGESIPPNAKSHSTKKLKEYEIMNILWQSLLKIYHKEENIKEPEINNYASSNLSCFFQTGSRISHLITDINDVIGHCVSLLEQVIAQSTSNQKINEKKIKFLSHHDFDDCRLCEILCGRSAELLSEKNGRCMLEIGNIQKKV